MEPRRANILKKVYKTSRNVSKKKKKNFLEKTNSEKDGPLASKMSMDWLDGAYKWFKHFESKYYKLIWIEH